MRGTETAASGAGGRAAAPPQEASGPPCGLCHTPAALGFLTAEWPQSSQTPYIPAQGAKGKCLSEQGRARDFFTTLLGGRQSCSYHTPPAEAVTMPFPGSRGDATGPADLSVNRMSKSHRKKSRRVGRQACGYLLQRQSASEKNRSTNRQRSFVSSEPGDDSSPLPVWALAGSRPLRALLPISAEAGAAGGRRQGWFQEGWGPEAACQTSCCPGWGKTPGTVAHQAPLSMGFSRQEHWSGLPLPPPRDLPDPGIEPGSPALQADSLPLNHQGGPLGRAPRGKNSNTSLCFSPRSCPTQPFASNNLYRITRMSFLKAGILLVPNLCLHKFVCKFVLFAQYIFVEQTIYVSVSNNCVLFSKCLSLR